MPQRAKGTSPDFPVLGTGQFDWKGFKPATPERRLPALRQAPAGGRPAPSSSPGTTSRRRNGRAADDQYDYGPLHREQMIADKVRAATKGKRQMTISQLVQAMEEPATQDLRGYRLLPTIFKAIGKPKSAGAAQSAGDAARPGTRPAPTAATSTATGSTRKRRRSS